MLRITYGFSQNNRMDEFSSKTVCVTTRGGQIAIWPRPKNLVWQINQTNFFWSGIWPGGLAFGLAVWSNRNRTKTVLNGMFAFFLATYDTYQMISKIEF